MATDHVCLIWDEMVQIFAGPSWSHVSVEQATSQVTHSNTFDPIKVNV